MARGRGFTLVEMVVVIVILGVIGTIAANVIRSGFSAYYTGQDISQADWQGKVALERITRELHEARERTGPTGLVGNLAAPDTQLVFTDIYGTTISYQQVGTTLMRQASPAVVAQPLADNIATPGLAFTYHTNSGIVVATTAASVDYITVSLSVDTPGLNTPKVYRATVRPRSFQ